MSLLAKDAKGNIVYTPSTVAPIPSTRNSHGNLFLFDSFENDQLAWYPILSVNQAFGTGSTVERSFNRAYDGKASLHMKVTQAFANIQAFRSFQHNSNKLSFEVFFTFNDVMRTVNDGQALFFELIYFDGTNARIFRVEHRPHFHQWTAWAHNSGNPDGPVDLPTLVANNATPANATTNTLASNFYIPAYDDPNATTANFDMKEGWANVKLWVDKSIPAYIGVEIDNQFYNLSGYTPINALANSTIPSGTRNWMAGLRIVEDTNAYVGHAYFDAVAIRDES